MDETDRSWTRGGIGEAAHRALTDGLPPSAVWSLLLGVVEQRVKQRNPASLVQQWQRDRFVTPTEIDQRTLLELDTHLLAAAEGFESIELSPLAPLGACAVIAPTSQNRIVSTTRGTEVVSDPTNVLALECARRLRRNPNAHVRLATSHRCVRAQEVPKRSGFAAHFRMFCLASAGREREDHAFVVDALIEHIRIHLKSLDRLAQHGYAFPQRTLRLLATPARQQLADRIASAIETVPIERAPLEHGYYSGLRFMVNVGSPASTSTAPGEEIPLIDGGAFNWLQKLTSNHRLAFVASGMGSQLAAYLFREASGK